MNRFISSIALLTLGFISSILGQTEGNDMDQFIGEWRGEGHFYNVNLSSEVGSVKITIRITPEMEILGTVGAAEIVDAEIEIDDWNDGYSIKGSVQGQIFPDNDFHKKRITLLLKPVEDGMTVADFHLANNFIFDFSMRPGGITLNKTP